MKATELLRLQTSDYQFRVYIDQHMVEGKTLFVGFGFGKLSFQKDKSDLLPGYFFSVASSSEEEIKTLAIDYIEMELDMEILASGPYEDNDWVDKLLPEK